MRTFLILTLFLLTSAFPAFTEEVVYPAAAHKLVIDPAKKARYQKLAKKIGVVFDKKYSYSDYAEIKRKYKVGAAGKYEFLLLSTGGNEFDYEASTRFNKQSRGWRMTYYKNHDLTVIDEVSRDPDGTHSWVRMLKIATGKRPKLNLE